MRCCDVEMLLRVSGEAMRQWSTWPITPHPTPHKSGQPPAFNQHCQRCNTAVSSSSKQFSYIRQYVLLIVVRTCVALSLTKKIFTTFDWSGNHYYFSNILLRLVWDCWDSAAAQQWSGKWCSPDIQPVFPKSMFRYMRDPSMDPWDPPIYYLVRSWSGLNTDFDFHDGEDIETLARKSKKKKEKFSREFHRNHFMFCSLYALSSLSRFCLATF